MPALRLFAAAREAAGVARADFDGATVGELLAAAESSFGPRFTTVLAQSRVWVNGEPATAETPVTGHDVVAVLPPVSGGAGEVLAPSPPPPPRPPRPAPRLDPLARTLPLRVPPSGPRQAGPAPMGGMGGGPRATGTAPGPGDRSATATAPPPTRAPVRTPRPERPVERGPRPERPVERGPGPERPVERGPGPERPVERGPRPERPVERGPRPERPVERGPRPERPVDRPAPTRAGDRGPRPGSPSTGASQPTATATRTETGPDQWWAPLARLRVEYDTKRPHGRIGFLWFVVTVAVVIAGPIWAAVWLGANAFVAASQAAGTRRSLDVHPPPWLAALASLAPPVAAVFGGRQVLGVVAVELVAAVLVRTFVNHRPSAHNVSLGLVLGVATGAAAASVVLTRAVNVEAAVYLLACACVYDAGAYLVGTGASAAWEGPVAGLVALIPVTILGAVVLVPPFPSGTPLALGLLAAVLAPLGPLAGTALLGRRDADAPGLRRLDSLILLGPAWAWLIARILR